MTNVARASLEELRLDFEDFLRQRGLALWGQDEPIWRALVAARCKTADEVAAWLREVHDQAGQAQSSNLSKASSSSSYPELAANAVLVLVNVVCSLLDRRVAALAAASEKDITVRHLHISIAARTLYWVSCIDFSTLVRS